MELVILMGLQGAGKSSFYRSRFANTHDHVSKDHFRNAGNREKRQRKLLEEALAQGRSVVVDNTNATSAGRAPLIALGRSLGAEIIGYYFESRLSDCLERNKLREGTARVPDIALYVTVRSLERPCYGEGFDKLSHVRIVPDAEFEVTDWIEDEGNNDKQRL